MLQDTCCTQHGQKMKQRGIPQYSLLDPASVLTPIWCQSNAFLTFCPSAISSRLRWPKFVSIRKPLRITQYNGTFFDGNANIALNIALNNRDSNVVLHTQSMFLMPWRFAEQETTQIQRFCGIRIPSGSPTDAMQTYHAIETMLWTYHAMVQNPRGMVNFLAMK